MTNIEYSKEANAAFLSGLNSVLGHIFLNRIFFQIKKPFLVGFISFAYFLFRPLALSVKWGSSYVFHGTRIKT